MKKHFYSHIIENETLLIELEQLDLEPEEREDLVKLVEANLHHAILEAVLDELSETDKQIFLEHIAHDRHDKVWEHLRSRIENIEGKIKATADSLMQELYNDIKAVKEESEED
jgi:hypothetical protein